MVIAIIDNVCVTVYFFCGIQPIESFSAATVNLRRNWIASSSGSLFLDIEIPEIGAPDT
jgi:hypothetical protein